MRSSFVRRALCALCGLALLAVFCPDARAEGVFTIDVDALDMNSLRDGAYIEQNLAACAQGVRVVKRVSDNSEIAAAVRLTIIEAETGALILDKNYGYQSERFDSGALYLPYVDNRAIPYIITLYAGDWVYAMPFIRLQARLERNGACLYGARMRDLGAGARADWLMGTPLDLEALRAQGAMTLPLCASNLYVVGQATISLSGDQLTLSLAFVPGANVEVHACTVYCALDASSVSSADARGMDAPAFTAGQPIDVAGARYALLYVPMSISYDSSGLGVFSYDPTTDGSLRSQLELFARWQAEAEAPPDSDPPADIPPDIPSEIESLPEPDVLPQPQAPPAEELSPETELPLESEIPCETETSGRASREKC